MTNFNTFLAESEKVKSLIEGDIEARELELYIENDSDLYHRQLLPIIKNIKRKMRRGKYDHSLAPKLWSYLVDNAAKKYAREFSTDESDWNMIFDKRTRIQVAQSLADDYADAITNGEYGELDESVRIDESRKMNYDQFVKHFETNILPLVKRQYEKDGKVDKPARREAFNDEMDALDREGMLQGDTYTWDGLPDRLEESASIVENNEKSDPVPVKKIIMKKGLHLTAGDKKSIKAILESKGSGNWKVGRKNFVIEKIEDNYYSVIITKNESDDYGKMKNRRSSYEIEVQ